jgi:hypothetical protein
VANLDIRDRPENSTHERAAIPDRLRVDLDLLPVEHPVGD